MILFFSVFCRLDLPQIPRVDLLVALDYEGSDGSLGALDAQEHVGAQADGGGIVHLVGGQTGIEVGLHGLLDDGRNLAGMGGDGGPLTLYVPEDAERLILEGARGLALVVLAVLCHGGESLENSPLLQ